MSNNTMRAAVFHEPGDASVLKVEELDKPTPGAGEVLVRVAACGINGFDLLARNGRYDTGQAKPHILGGDVTGWVEAYGEHCSKTIAAGTPVALHWVKACGLCEQCLRGFETTCLSYGYLGAKYPGGYAEYVLVPERALVPLSHDADLIEAAAFPMAFGTSWHMLITRGQLRPNETVLIQAVGSGLGVAGLQIAQLVGANVIASAGSDWKLERAIEMGVSPDNVINYNTSDLRTEIMRITNKRGVDIAFEHIGGDGFADLVGSVTRNGRIVTCGGTAGYSVKMNIAQIFHKQISIIGSNSATRAEMTELFDLYQNNALKPVVDRVFPLDEAAAAHEYMDARSGFGKVVLDVAGQN